MNTTEGKEEKPRLRKVAKRVNSTEVHIFDTNSFKTACVIRFEDEQQAIALHMMLRSMQSKDEILEVRGK